MQECIFKIAISSEFWVLDLLSPWLYNNGDFVVVNLRLRNCSLEWNFKENNECSKDIMLTALFSCFISVSKYMHSLKLTLG